jgi:hypothetical protein
VHEGAIAKNERGWPSYPRNATSGACSGLNAAQGSPNEIKYKYNTNTDQPDRSKKWRHVFP